MVGFAVACAFLALTLRQTRPEMAAMVAIAGGACIFVEAAQQLEGFAGAFQKLSEAAGLKSGELERLMKITGIAVLSESGGQICRDAGENGLASKVEMLGRMTALVLAAPLALELCEEVLSFVG